MTWGDRAISHWGSHLASTDTMDILNFIARLPLPESTKVLDLGCANGRIAIPLALGGAEVSAVDESEHMLAELRMVAQAAGVALETAIGDISDLQELVRRSFDLILLLDSTLNMLDPARQVACIKGCSERLSEGGLLLIQCYNPLPGMLAGKPIFGIARHEDGMIITRVFRMADGVRFSGTIYVVSPNGARTDIHSETYPISGDVLSQITAKAGLYTMMRYGDWDLNGLSEDSPQCIYVVARNPKGGDA